MHYVKGTMLRIKLMKASRRYETVWLPSSTMQIIDLDGAILPGT